MSGTGAHLALHSDRCDQCGACASACPENAVTVGPGYLGIDWARCTRCCACVSACRRQAIQRADVPERGAVVSVGVSDTSKVVVGSRAEAKAVRKAAEQAAKQAAKARGKSIAYGGKPLPIAAGGARAAVVASASSGGVAVAAGVPQVRAADGAAATTPGAQVRPVFKRATLQRPPFVPGTVSWTRTDLFAALAMLLATVLAKDAVLGLHAVGLMPSAARTIVRAAVLGVYYSIQLAAFAWLATRHRETLWAAFGVGVVGREGHDDAPVVLSVVATIGLVLAMFVGSEVFSVAYGLGMQAAGITQPLRLSSDLAEVFGGGGLGLALSIVLVALVAPFVEELAFRGIVLPVFGARWGMWPAILGSAAVYAVYHFSVWLFAPTFVLGIALGWLAWNRRSLVPAIWLHVLYNAAAVAAGFLVAR